MRRSSAATSDGQMDHGQVRKPRISRQKPVTWPDTAFGHLTGYGFGRETVPQQGATSDGQMDHGQVRKPRISRQKPVTWPDTAFGHLTRYGFVGRGGLLLHGPFFGSGRL